MISTKGSKPCGLKTDKQKSETTTNIIMEQQAGSHSSNTLIVAIKCNWF